MYALSAHSSDFCDSSDPSSGRLDPEPELDLARHNQVWLGEATKFEKRLSSAKATNGHLPDDLSHNRIFTSAVRSNTHS